MFARLVARDGPGCFYCHLQFEPTTGNPTITLDHFVPQSHGGKTSYHNLRLACYKCNHLKGGLSGEEFLRDPRLLRRRERNTGARLIAQGIHPKGGYWHREVVRTSPQGTAVILMCLACGGVSEAQYELRTFPCIRVTE
jgi:hypothetical protein